MIPDFFTKKDYLDGEIAKKFRKEETEELLIPPQLKEFFDKYDGRVIYIPYDKQGKPMFTTKDERIFPDETNKEEIHHYKMFYEYMEGGQLRYYPRHPSQHPDYAIKRF